MWTRMLTAGGYWSRRWLDYNSRLQASRWSLLYALCSSVIIEYNFGFLADNRIDNRLTIKHIL
jgi:hypothetical protein